MLGKATHPDWHKGKSIPFDRFLTAKDKQVQNVVDYFKEKIPNSRSTPEQRKVLRTLIANLLEASEQKVNLEYYIGNQAKARQTVIHKLIRCNLIEYQRGSNFEEGEVFTSKLMPLPLFYDLFHPLIRVTIEDEMGKKTQIRSEDPKVMPRIFDYNELMKDHAVLDGSGNRLGTNIHRCHHIYCGDKKEYKYRFHQASYQSLPDNERSKITIDGEAVCRFDITGSHCQILHNIAGYAMTHKPYEAFPEYPEMVAVCKCAMMMIMNNPSRKSATGAFNKELNNNPVRFHKSALCMKEHDIRTKDIFDEVEALNPNIKKYFYSSACREAMTMEAQILFITMEILIKKKSIPSVQVFDELIVPASKEAEAKEVLEMVWKHNLKFTPRYKIERPKMVSSPTVDYLKIFAA